LAVKLYYYFTKLDNLVKSLSNLQTLNIEYFVDDVPVTILTNYRTITVEQQSYDDFEGYFENVILSAAINVCFYPV
jgi:hypothetical protein